MFYLDHHQTFIRHGAPSLCLKPFDSHVAIQLKIQLILLNRYHLMYYLQENSSELCSLFNVNLTWNNEHFRRIKFCAELPQSVP